MEAILNELSVIPFAEDDLDGRMLQLIQAVRSLLAHGMRRVVRSTKDALERVLDGETTLRRWLFSRGALKEEKEFLRSLLSKAPYVDDFEVDAESERAALLEFKLGEQQARGLGIAHLHDVPAVSIRGDTRFQEPHIEISFRSVAEVAEDVRNVPVIHVATTEHVIAHRTWLEERIARAVRSGVELWEQRVTLFPQLDFCACVQKQIEDLFGAERYFPEVVRHLHVLSRTASEWESGEFSPPLRWSYESKQTMANRAFASARTFLCPDNVQREFSAHSKISVEAKRILFMPNAETRRVWIGHVGDHLPTVLF